MTRISIRTMTTKFSNYQHQVLDQGEDQDQYLDKGQDQDLDQDHNQNPDQEQSYD